MFKTTRAAEPALCLMLTYLMLVLPGCRGTNPVNHPVDLQRLLVAAEEPSYYDDQFAPISEEEKIRFTFPPPPPYLLGKGDVVSIKVLNTEDLPGFPSDSSLEARVKDDGNLYLPEVRKVEAAGKTVVQVQDDITAKLKDYLRDPFVSVDVVSFNSQKFFVVGEVGTPSALPVTGGSTLFEALIAVGGTKLETADLDESYIVRSGEALPFSIKDIVMKSHPAGRMVMQENDVVYVPHVKDREDYIYIFGEVRSPGRIPMEHEGPRGTKGGMTLAAALAQVGGLASATADPNQIHVYRGNWQCPREYVIGQHEVYAYGEGIHLRPGDRIWVGLSGSAKFSNMMGPTLMTISTVSSLTALGISAAALAR